MIIRTLKPDEEKPTRVETISICFCVVSLFLWFAAAIGFGLSRLLTSIGVQ